MNILLVNPRYLGGTISYFPLGMAYLASYLMQNNYRVVICDRNLKQTESNDVSHYIKRHGIDVVGISGFITQVKHVITVIDRIKDEYPHLPVVLGGPQTHGTSEFFLRHTRADFVISGTGELPFLNLLNALVEEQSLEGVSGLSYRRRDGSIMVQPPNPSQQNQFFVKQPAYELFDIEKYLDCNYHGFIGKKSLDIIWSRGCPYSCSYCIYSLKGYKVSFRPIEDLMTEIRHLREHFGITDFIFADENFTLNRKRTLEMVDELKKEEVTWVTSARVDLLDEEILTRMKEAGCRKMMLGLESFSRKVLQNMNKKVKLECIPEKIKLIRTLGIQLEANFMVGMPEETPETIKDTERYCIENSLFFGPSYVTPFPGTKLYEDCRDIIGDQKQYILKLGDLNFSKTMLINLTRFPQRTIIKLRNQAVVNSLSNILKRKVRFMPMPLVRIVCRGMLITADLDRPYFLARLFDFAKIRLLKPFLISRGDTGKK